MSLDRQAIFDVVRSNTLKILSDLSPAEITPERSLTELGANSVDRVEIVLSSLEELNLKVPATRLHGLRNLGELAELIYEHLPP